MNEEQIKQRLIAGVGDDEMRKLRIHTASIVGKTFEATGSTIPAILKPSDAYAKDLIALSILLRMAGELTTSATKLFSNGSHYAGAALLRQLVEIEYLTWNFKEKTKTPADWLDSTHEQRLKDFSPSALRKTSKGRFLFQDYQNHCEQGGHPVLRGAHLLGSGNKEGVQVLIVDMITHAWRTWDQVNAYSKTFPDIKPIVVGASSKIYPALRKWGEADPIYATMVEHAPEPHVP
jgi:hypothetical protein